MNEFVTRELEKGIQTLENKAEEHDEISAVEFTSRFLATKMWRVLNRVIIRLQ
jgi:hypothetical protein